MKIIIISIKIKNVKSNTLHRNIVPTILYRIPLNILIRCEAYKRVAPNSMAASPPPSRDREKSMRKTTLDVASMRATANVRVTEVSREKILVAVAAQRLLRGSFALFIYLFSLFFRMHGRASARKVLRNGVLSRSHSLLPPRFRCSRTFFFAVFGRCSLAAREQREAVPACGRSTGFMNDERRGSTVRSFVEKKIERISRMLSSVSLLLYF